MISGITSRPKRVLQGTATGITKGESTHSTPRVDIDQLLDDKAEYYGKALTSALNKANVPLKVEGSTTLFQPDYNWGKWTNTYYGAFSPNDNRLAYAQKSHDLNPMGQNYYSAGIDNLASVLGDNYYSGSYDLPLGINASYEYDGDTLAGSLEVPQRGYYLQALSHLLNR